MVHELHKRGYQRLRIMPGLSPSGLHWRCNVTPASNILREHGAKAVDVDFPSANYTSAMGNRYFDWEDAEQATARDLADRFVERFPQVAAMGIGRDWEYVGWYVEMLAHAERGALPISYADWYIDTNPRFLPTTESVDSGLPMPPGGEAELLAESE